MRTRVRSAWRVKALRRALQGQCAWRGPVHKARIRSPVPGHLLPDTRDGDPLAAAAVSPELRSTNKDQRLVNLYCYVRTRETNAKFLKKQQTHARWNDPIWYCALVRYIKRNINRKALYNILIGNKSFLYRLNDPPLGSMLTQQSLSLILFLLLSSGSDKGNFGVC